jgi:DNA replication protein DnaC
MKYQAEYNTAQAAAKQSQIVRQRNKWKEASGLPAKFINASFNTYDINASDKDNNLSLALAKCKEYAKSYPMPYRRYAKSGKAYPSLYLWSTKAGLGKTHLACSIANAIYDRWNGEGLEELEYSQIDFLPIKWRCSMLNPVTFISEPELYNKLQNTYNYSDDERKALPSASEIINQLIFCDLLILDDVGKDPRRDMDFVRRTLFAIIDGRYKALRPIVLTTNLKREELRVYLDGSDGDSEPKFSRLVEMGSFFHIKGEDYRRKKP